MKDAEREPSAIRLFAQRTLAIVVAIGIAVYSIGPAVVPIANRLLVTWIAASSSYLVLYWLTILHANADLIRRRARKYDEAAYVIFLLVTSGPTFRRRHAGFACGPEVRVRIGVLPLNQPRHTPSGLAALEMPCSLASS